MTGRFIVLESVDEALLAAHSRELAAHLRGRGLQVFVTGEPSDGPVGGQIRQVAGGRLLIAGQALPLLHLADRIDHLYREGDGIDARLRSGAWVIGTRYLLEAVAQGSGAAEVGWLARINQPCPWPELVIFLQPAAGAARTAQFEEAITWYRRAGRSVHVVASDAVPAAGAAPTAGAIEPAAEVAALADALSTPPGEAA